MRSSAAARFVAGLLSIAVMLFAASCATVPPGALDRLQGRTVEGRLSVRYTNLESAKEESVAGRFVWTANRDDIELSLLDPLGQTVALIRSSAARSTITFRDGRRVDGATPEELTRETLGWTVPLRGLGAWLDGHADPASPSTTLDDGRLRQDAWTIRFQADDTAAAGAPPRRIDLAYPGPPVAIEMRLVVDRRDVE